MPKQIITGGGPQSGGVVIGAAASEKIGFHGATPVVQRAHANQAVPTNEATLITFCTQIRSDLIALGLIKGEA